MAKAASQSQAAFSFLDEVAQATPLPKPKKNTLKPPEQIVVDDEKQSVAEVKEPNIEEAIPDMVDDVLPEQPSFEEHVLQDKGAEIIKTTETPLKDIAHQDIRNDKKNSRGRKSVKENTLAANSMEIPDDEELFSKQYYSMGEVTTMFNENHSLIRYWESEFDILKPKKNGKGDRFFRPADVKNLYLIYDLLRRRKFTIEGAREYLKNNKKADEKFAAIQSLEKIKSFFLELKATL